MSNYSQVFCRADRGKGNRSCENYENYEKYEKYGSLVSLRIVPMLLKFSNLPTLLNLSNFLLLP